MLESQTPESLDENSALESDFPCESVLFMYGHCVDIVKSNLFQQ